MSSGLLLFPWQENHGKSRKSANVENHGNHGKSRKRKLKFLLISIVVPGCHRKSRKITETEMKVPVVCYCCSWLLSVRVCISLCVFSCDMSSSDENGTPAAKKRKVWQRGSKMQHPAIKGLMWKYTKVHGCIRNKDEVYKASRRAGLLHKGAIRHKIKNQKCWVGTDEWTDEQGHAINVLIGVGPKVYVVATLQLYPVTGTAIERSFSLAGLVDVKNRQSMGKDLREACVTMFCNGDVEERFAKWQ